MRPNAGQHIFKAIVMASLFDQGALQGVHDRLKTWKKLDALSDGVIGAHHIG